MERLELQGAHGLGAAQQIGGDGETQQQHGRRPGQPPVCRQAIDGQSRQIDQPQSEEKTPR